MLTLFALKGCIEVEEIHKTLYPVLKQAKRERKRAVFNFDKLIIDGQIYRGKETKNLPFKET